MNFHKKLTYVLITLLALALAACAPQVAETPAGEMPEPTETPAVEETAAPDALANTQWTLVSMGVPDAPTPVAAGSTITLAFEAGNQASGSGGCNSYGGAYQVEGSALSFSGVASTLMACADPAANEQEGQYYQALQTAGEFELAGDQLLIWYEGGQKVLTFVSGSAAPAPAETAPAESAAPSPAASDENAASTGPAGIGPDVYIDDRSGPAELLQSYFNAINRREYARAYSYWDNPDQAGSFESFQQGYADTQSVELTTGIVGSDAGAGQLYYAVPVVLDAQTTGGAAQRFAGCYVLHLSQPGVQGEPPFRPLGIDKATVEEVTAESNTETLLAAACQEQNANPITAEPPADPADISADNYIDNRSGPAELLRSYFNAINRQEYVRAYSYWEAGAAAASFADFEQGYAVTQSVELEIGPVVDGAAAGSTYYDVSVMLRVRTVDEAMQFFTGCYRLHLGSPAAQAAPPFRPLGIMTANVQEVASEAEAAALLELPCPK